MPEQRPYAAETARTPGFLLRIRAVPRRRPALMTENGAHRTLVDIHATGGTQRHKGAS